MREVISDNVKGNVDTIETNSRSSAGRNL